MQTNSKQEVKVIANQVRRVYNQTIELTVNDEVELKKAANVLTLVKASSKELKAKKKAILDPLNQAIGEIKTLFKEPEEQLTRAEATLKDAMLAYHESQAEAARKKIDRINGRLERGTMKVATGMAKLAGIDQAESNIFTENGGVQFRHSSEKVRITSVDDLLSARPDLLQRKRVVEALRMELAADIKAGIPVPNGAEVYRDKVVAGIAV